MTAGGEAKRSVRACADWLGSALFLALAVKLVVDSPTFGMLLLPGLVLDLAVAVAFLCRRPAITTLPGWTPKVVAFAGSFLLLIFVDVARTWHRDWLAPTAYPTARAIGQLSWWLGLAIALWALWALRRAFSIVPQARELVTTGPYRLARHPMYLGYVLANLGVWLQYPTVPSTIAVAAWLGLTLGRMWFEERALRQAFPDYATYCRRVGPLWPRPRV
jgi:protein-S-isoprenylcysteine O-methyltransferase Ste14